MLSIEAKLAMEKMVEECGAYFDMADVIFCLDKAGLEKVDEYDAYDYAETL